MGHGNKPDITAVAAAGKVPVEIKPVYKKLYSANSLAATLRDQVAGKYLAHGDSRNGVLVVLNLEDKKWEIPGGRKDGAFADLITYLRAEAEALAQTHPSVERIEITGIDCIDRGTS
ncbi:MAG: hypothetical protein ABL931_05140 [Usitatibacteraceae bacterium]